MSSDKDFYSLDRLVIKATQLGFNSHEIQDLCYAYKVLSGYTIFAGNEHGEDKTRFNLDYAHKEAYKLCETRIQRIIDSWQTK